MTVSWDPRSESDLAAAIDAGVLAETHYQDIKREIGSRPGDRKELARDLSQFALDGGKLIIGIHEDKDARTWTLAPQPLAGLSEQIELIARSNIDPGLSFTVALIESDNDPALGYAIVHVPPSAHAPHMVDGVYYGRGDTTRIRMSDAEVLRWHRGRESADDRIRRLLDEEIARDPVQPAANRQYGHLYLVAQPEISRPGLATALVRDDPTYIHRIVTFSAEQEVDPELRQWAPSAQSASSTATRANGIAMCSHTLRNARTFTPENVRSEPDAVDIEIAEDGGIRVFVGRMTDTTDDGAPWILDGLAIAYAARTVHWARMISTTVGYHSGWLFGLAANSLRGRASIAHRGAFSDGPQYDRDDHYATTTSSSAELRDDPQKVIERLVGPLLRGLGTAEHYRDKVNYHPPKGQDPSRGE